MNPLRMGVIGLGVMGGSYLKPEAGIEQISFVGVADSQPEILKSTSERLGIPGYSTAEALIDSGTCEAVVIATPHALHSAIGEYAAARGLHILSEHPIGTSVVEADRLIEKCRQAGVVLGVMYQQRTEPIYRKTKELLDGGLIGRTHHVSVLARSWFRTQAYYDAAPWRGTWKGAGGGVIITQADHLLDLLIWLAGVPRQVVAKVQTLWHNIEVEDTVEVMLDFGSGKSGYFWTSTWDWPPQTRFEFVGDTGRLVVEDRKLLLYRMEKSVSDLINSGSTRVECEGAWEQVRYEETPKGHWEVLRQFARAVRLGEPSIVTGDDGRNVLELVNGILLSGHRHKPVLLPVNRPEYDAFLKEKRLR